MIRKIFQNNFLQLKCKNHLTQREIAEKLSYPTGVLFVEQGFDILKLKDMTITEKRQHKF